MSNLTIIIPTRNEEIHIKRVVLSALSVTDQVFVVDSDSTDKTQEIASHEGAKVYNYEWTKESNFSRKLNWAMQNLPIVTDWVMRLDADEVIEGDWKEEIEKLNSLTDNVKGVNIYQWYFFLDGKIRHGDHIPRPLTRIIRKGILYEDRWLDEHPDLEGGDAIQLNLFISDKPIATFDKWIEKHNIYSIREAVMEIDNEIGLSQSQIAEKGSFDKQALRVKRQKKMYSKMPHYWRCFFYFLYIYFYKLGFLDGRAGFMKAFYHTFWYRFLVDTKINEIYRRCGKDREKILDYVEKTYNFKFDVRDQKA